MQDIMDMGVGDRLVDAFQPSDNGRFDLNLPALTTLIRWAEGDEALAQRFGTWDQGVWSQVLVAESGLDWDSASDKYADGLSHEEVLEKTRNGVCQTAYCMAGQTVVQAGYRLIYNFNEHEEDDDGTGLGEHVSLETTHCTKQEFLRFDERGKPVFRDTGETMEISEAAREILGMDHEESSRFFDGSNDIDDLKHMLNIFCQRRDMPEPYPGVESGRAYDMCSHLVDRRFD